MYLEFTWTQFWITLVLIAGVMAAVQGTCAYLILAERKISAWAQDRLGPNRVGPWGLLQPIADGLKFLFKEQVIPAHVDRLFYLLAPMVGVATALLALAVVPVGRTTAAPVLLERRPEAVILEYAGQPFTAARLAAALKEHPPLEVPTGAAWAATRSEQEWLLGYDRAWAEQAGQPTFEQKVEEYRETVQFVIAPHVDIGAVFVFAIGSLAVYAIVLGGWSSNNKYSFLGSLRSSAQFISYEIPLGMSILGVFLVTGSLNLERIIDHQAHHGWNILFQPLAALLFITSVFAETNRVPFDLPEAEQELVGGYHTEYSGMKFALFFLGEYTHMITTSFLVVIAFFGGWLFPGLGTGTDSPTTIVLKLLVLAAKMGLFIVFYMFIRWTLPRFRFDQLMSLAWKVMMPLALLNLLAVLFVQHYQPLGPLSPWLLLPISLLIVLAAGALSLRRPRPPAPATVRFQGHPTTGLERVTAG